MVPLSTRICLKSNKLRPILNGQFWHAISKNICLNVFGSKQPWEILVFVIFKLLFWVICSCSNCQKYMENFDHWSILVDNGSIVQWGTFFGPFFSYVIWHCQNQLKSAQTIMASVPLKQEIAHLDVEKRASNHLGKHLHAPHPRPNGQCPYMETRHFKNVLPQPTILTF